jgi:hypothetical protein
MLAVDVARPVSLPNDQSWAEERVPFPARRAGLLLDATAGKKVPG